MEVAIGNNGNSPFQREVREWQHIDPNTGALLTGRLEADRWINGPLNKYGKVVDSQNVSQPNGTQLTQRKQLEVLQARTSSGSMQVIRAQTVQTTSSRWSSSTPTATTTQSYDGQRISSSKQNSKNLNSNQIIHKDNYSYLTNGIEQHMSNNKKYLTTEPSAKLSNLMKTNGNVGSSNNSSSGRISPHLNNNSIRQHENHVKKSSILDSCSTRYDHQQQKQKPTTIDLNHVGGTENLKNHEMEKFQNKRETDLNFERGRSASIDDLATDWNGSDSDANNQSCEWRRVSKIRRSFQFPKTSTSPPRSTRPVDLPENSVSVSKIRSELENGRRLNTAMRNNHVDLIALDTILNGLSDNELSPKSLKKNGFLTAESLKEIRGRLKKLSDESLYKDDYFTTTDKDKLQIESSVVNSTTENTNFHENTPENTNSPKHTTNSLESRSRVKDTSSTEWHLRRKSYGFENMPPPDQKSMFRFETSTDSGIGRSSELNNWSPTAETRGTIITFGDGAKNSTTVVLRGSSPNKPIVHKRFWERKPEEVEVKRHSIAVDETKYVRDNLKKVFDTKTSVHLNGFYPESSEESNRRLKRVEFCKTEVHFAAESGIVNIVETDGKPPPTNNFRRRRRSSGNAYIDAITSGMQVTHFGDEQKSTIFEQESESSDEVKTNRNVTNVTVSIPSNDANKANQISVALDDILTEDEVTPRGILKNKPIKPKPYHLGENIECSDSLWGVKLKPVNNNDNQIKRLKEQDGKAHIKEGNLEATDQIKIIEERKEGTGYSTKINLNLTDKPFLWNSETDKFETHKSNQVTDITDSTNILTNCTFHSTKISSNQENLKSTSLIMKTINNNSSQEEIRPYKRSLVKNSIRSTTTSTAARLISNMREITKSNSANSIFSEPEKRYRPRYSSSLDGDCILNDNDEDIRNSVPNSPKYDVNHKPYGIPETSENFSTQSFVKKPVAAPRTRKIIDRLENHNFSQIQKIYEKPSGFESDDSALADEEVKRYLGDESDANNFIKYDTKLPIGSDSESAGSWSRMKAQKIVHKTKFDVKDVPKSNIMSIELRSPKSTLRKKHSTGKINKPNNYKTRETNLVPIAKPRTKSVTQTPVIMNSPVSQHQQSSPITNSSKCKSDSEHVEPLKIVLPRGARQLREHELSYFGVKTNKEPSKNTTRLISKTNEFNRKLTTIEQIKIDENEQKNDNKWKLSSDKPDLLRHSPVSKKLPNEIKTDINYHDDNGPVYENLRKPSAYNRKKDLKRDEMILNEMTESADQTLKTVADNHRIKDQRAKRRSMDRRPSIPLDPIDEKPLIRDAECKDKETKHILEFERKCCSRRSSSASSIDSNLSSTSSIRHENNYRAKSKVKEYVHSVRKAQIKPPSAAVVIRQQGENDSSSRDETSTQNSSTENLTLSPGTSERRVKRATHSKLSRNSLEKDPFTRNKSNRSNSDNADRSSAIENGKDLQRQINRRNSQEKIKKINEKNVENKESRRSVRTSERKSTLNCDYESDRYHKGQSQRSSRAEMNNTHYRSKSNSKTDDLRNSKKSSKQTAVEKAGKVKGLSNEHHKTRVQEAQRLSVRSAAVATNIVNTTTKTISSAKPRTSKDRHRK